MLPDRISNPGALTYESGALPIALRGPASPCDGYMVWSELLSKKKKKKKKKKRVMRFH